MTYVVNVIHVNLLREVKKYGKLPMKEAEATPW